MNCGPRSVTVMFLDLGGSMNSTRAPDEGNQPRLTAALFAQVAKLIAAAGGTVQKHARDSLLASFGARQARENDPIQTVQATLRIQA